MTDSTAAPQPSPAYRWLVLVVISLAMFGNYYIYDSIAPIADLLKSELGFTDENIGFLYSSYSVAAVVILLFGGVLVELVPLVLPVVHGVFGHQQCLGGRLLHLMQHFQFRLQFTEGRVEFPEPPAVDADVFLDLAETLLGARQLLLLLLAGFPVVLDRLLDPGHQASDGFQCGSVIPGGCG